jgi:hypothetical protein
MKSKKEGFILVRPETWSACNDLLRSRCLSTYSLYTIHKKKKYIFEDCQDWVHGSGEDSDVNAVRQDDGGNISSMSPLVVGLQCW